MRLFRGVLDRDALDPERRNHLKWKRERAKRALTMSSNSAFGFSIKRHAKVMDHVSENRPDDSDKDDGLSREGTPP